MINDFHFSHEFLACDSLKISIISDSIINNWLNYGCLLAPFAKLTEYKEWIEYHDPKSCQKWTTAFSHCLINDITDEYKSVSDLLSLENCFNYMDTLNIPTLLINEEELKKLKVENGKHVRDSLEIININNFDESSSFKKSESLKNLGILEGDKINDIWSERFFPIVKKTKTITIIDRYFSKNLEEDINIRITSIERFIDFLSQSGKKHSITIYSSGGDKNSGRHSTISNYIDRVLSKRPTYKSTISHFEVNSCDDKLFQKNAHDRFIQFDDFTLQLGSGMAIFRSYDLNACSFSFYRSAKDPIFKTALSTMSKHRKWRHVV